MVIPDSELSTSNPNRYYAKKLQRKFSNYRPEARLKQYNLTPMRRDK